MKQFQRGLCQCHHTLFNLEILTSRVVRTFRSYTTERRHLIPLHIARPFVTHATPILFQTIIDTGPGTHAQFQTELRRLWFHFCHFLLKRS